MQKTPSRRPWPERPTSAAHGHHRSDMRAGKPPERLTLRNSRQWICSRATGSVLEVSIGTGLNLRDYPDHVALTALDLDQELLSLARRRSDVFQHASLLQGGAAQLPFPTGSFPVRPLAATGPVPMIAVARGAQR